MKVNIDLPNDMIKAIDVVANKNFYTRSEWIRVAIREKMGISPQGIQDKEEVSTDEIKEKKEKKINIPGVVKGAVHCKHGYMVGLCKFGCTE